MGEPGKGEELFRRRLAAAADRATKLIVEARNDGIGPADAAMSFAMALVHACDAIGIEPRMFLDMARAQTVAVAEVPS